MITSDLIILNSLDNFRLSLCTLKTWYKPQNNSFLKNNPLIIARRVGKFCQHIHIFIIYFTFICSIKVCTGFLHPDLLDCANYTLIDELHHLLPDKQIEKGLTCALDLFSLDLISIAKVATKMVGPICYCKFLLRSSTTATSGKLPIQAPFLTLSGYKIHFTIEQMYIPSLLYSLVFTEETLLVFLLLVP